MSIGRSCGKFLAYFLVFLLIKIFLLLYHDLMKANGIWSLFYAHKSNKRYASDKMTSPLLAIPCGNLSGYDALMVVHSSVHDFLRRHEYRNTYGSYSFTYPRQIKLVFLLGMPSDPRLQHDVRQEHYFFRDTVQGHFVDAYANLTYKAVMGFRWISQTCSDVNVIIKMDDDVLLNVPKFFEEVWPPPFHLRHMIQCHMWEWAPTERSGKWMLTQADYKKTYFPPYCSGFLVVVPFDLTHELYRIARRLPFVWVDDAFIYGIVRKKSGAIQIIHSDRFAYSSDEYRKCISEYGPRCKYVGVLLEHDKPFIASILTMMKRGQKVAENMTRFSGYLFSG